MDKKALKRIARFIAPIAISLKFFISEIKEDLAALEAFITKEK